jgi:hypothetical protein
MRMVLLGHLDTPDNLIKSILVRSNNVTTVDISKAGVNSTH